MSIIHKVFKNLINGAKAIRISSICFLLTVICALLYAGWVEADRMFNAQTILLEKIKKEHGFRLNLEKTDSSENGVLKIGKSDISLGVHGSGVLEGIQVEDQKVTIKKGTLLVFEDNPWQWVYGLCGKGQNVQITIENLVVKTAIGKMYSLGNFAIHTSGPEGIKGSCDKFTLEQTGDTKYVVEGDLFAFIPAFEKLSTAVFMKVSLPKITREINGVGYCSLEITAIQSLLFEVTRPILLNSNWSDKSLGGYSIFDNKIIELKSNPESLDLKTSGKGEGFVWNGKINANEEEYQVYVDGEITLASLLKSGSFSDHYQVPEHWQSKLNGLYEFKRKTKSGKLEVRAISENRSLELFEVAR